MDKRKLSVISDSVFHQYLPRTVTTPFSTIASVLQYSGYSDVSMRQVHVYRIYQQGFFNSNLSLISRYWSYILEFNLEPLVVWLWLVLWKQSWFSGLKLTQPLSQGLILEQVTLTNDSVTFLRLICLPLLFNYRQVLTFTFRNIICPITPSAGVFFFIVLALIVCWSFWAPL